MIYGYARVSTKGQAINGNSLEEQEQQLKAHGASVIYMDSYTGTTMDRPNFDKLKSEIQPGDTLMVTKLDRIARSATQGSDLVQELINKGINVHVLNIGLMNNTPTGKLTVTILFAFAEFERDMIIERTSEGKRIAKQSEDYREGRPKKDIDLDTFKDMLNKQQNEIMTVKECCQILNISRSTWYNKVKEVAVC